jgi:hypothetical protein
MRIYLIFAISIILAGCWDASLAQHVPTEIIIDNPFNEIEIIKKQLGERIYIYSQNNTIDVIKQLEITSNGEDIIYTGAFGNIEDLLLFHVDYRNGIYHIIVEDLVFY